MSEHGEVSDSTTEADEVDGRTTGAADRAATPEEARMADQHGDALTSTRSLSSPRDRKTLSACTSLARPT